MKAVIADRTYTEKTLELVFNEGEAHTLLRLLEDTRNYIDCRLDPEQESILVLLIGGIRKGFNISEGW